MKKLFTFIFTAFHLFVCFNTNVSANDNIITETLKLDDGSYFITTIEESSIELKSSSTKSGKKTTNYYDKNDQLLWSVTVTGTFTYTGSSATCTSSSVSTTCPDSRWKITSKSSSKKNASASATATAKRYSNNTVVETKTKTVTLTCSATGKLS